jgi:hypothetical protein
MLITLMARGLFGKTRRSMVDHGIVVYTRILGAGRPSMMRNLTSGNGTYRSSLNAV